MEFLKDAHYFQLPSQGNIYTVADLQLANGLKKLLVASLKRDIFCLEYSNVASQLVPTIKEIPFTYIPGGAEIISIDAFNKSVIKNEFVVGITIIKNNNELDSLETFLNIYSEWEENDEFNIENIAQKCLTVQLNFIPYILQHTFLLTWKNNEIISKEVVFILSGSDHYVHVYREHTQDHLYKEIDKDFFPEFTKTPSPVIWVDFYHTDNFESRFTAICCECGYVNLTKTCIKTNTVQFNFCVRFSNYISCIKIYNTSPDSNKQIAVPNSIKTNTEDNKIVLNLVILNSILPSVIFQDFLTYGLSNYFPLPRHDTCTSVLTSCLIADIDFDGIQEILIGNSARELLLMKHTKDKGWCLEELKKITSPIYNLKYLDLSGDGVKELVVVTMKGIHVFQYDTVYVQKVITRKVEEVLLNKLENLIIKD